MEIIAQVAGVLTVRAALTATARAVLSRREAAAAAVISVLRFPGAEPATELENKGDPMKTMPKPLRDSQIKAALGALCQALYFGSTPLVRVEWVLQQSGLTYDQSSRFIGECVAAHVLERHNFGTRLSMTGAGRQLYRDFDSIKALAS